MVLVIRTPYPSGSANAKDANYQNYYFFWKKTTPPQCWCLNTLHRGKKSSGWLSKLFSKANLVLLVVNYHINYTVMKYMIGSQAPPHLTLPHRIEKFYWKKKSEYSGNLCSACIGSKFRNLNLYPVLKCCVKNRKEHVQSESCGYIQSYDSVMPENVWSQCSHAMKHWDTELTCLWVNCLIQMETFTELWRNSLWSMHTNCSIFIGK